VKLGRKLALIDDFNKRNYNLKEAKVDYYKHMKPHAGAYKTQAMDPNQLIIQKAHMKNREYMEKNKHS